MNHDRRIQTRIINRAIVVVLFAYGLAGCNSAASSNSASENISSPEVTGYRIACFEDSAVAVSTASYRIDVHNQTVIQFDSEDKRFNLQSRIFNLKNCKVWSVSDWECDSPHEVGKVGFSGGIARSQAVLSTVMLGVDSETWEKSTKDPLFAKALCNKRKSFLEAVKFDDGKSNSHRKK